VKLAVPADFSGVVSVSRGGTVEFEQAYGLADRAHGIPVRVDTRFATASATKGFTACTVVSLIGDGVLSYDTPARKLLGPDLPLIADDVTVEHLLAHRSGIGDYIDESRPDPPLPTVPVDRLVDTDDYLPALDGFAQTFAPGQRFAYCNSGFVVLALMAERAAGHPFVQLVAERVFGPAGMSGAGFLRSDELPGSAAIGYLEDGRTNVFRLPVRGNGDGGAYATVADIRAFWAALFAGRLVPDDQVRRMVQPHSSETGHPLRYGLGFWLAPAGSAVLLEGADHGVSFRSAHNPATGLTWTVVSNTGDGAWPVARLLRERFGPG
jgi:CubicO group peptidase (beta-lactamase class C family)